MELPQPRPLETEGRKRTHDFLSLCSSHSTVQPDPRTSSHAGGYLKTHNFLLPLERVGRSCAKEETSSVDTLGSEWPLPPPAPPPSSADQHVLPGGIGTYTISQIPYFHQRIPKPEESPMFTVSQASSTERNTNEYSNCSSYATSGFTLWDESAMKKGQTRMENVGEQVRMRGHVEKKNDNRLEAGEATTKGQWPGSEPWPHSLTNNHRGSFSSHSSQVSGQKSQSFMDMIRSAKGSSQDDEDDEDEEFVMKKERPSSSQKVDLGVKVGGKSTGNVRKPSTPRSKHSATEQRRRSKINDRFQMLRQLIPNSDQKRDKASFLLEVIEYVQFLQEKADKYEGSYLGFNPEPGKLMDWRNSQQLPEGSVSFAPKLEDENNVPVPQTVIAQDGLVMDQQRPGTLNRAGAPFHLSLQPNVFPSPVITGSPVSQFPTRIVSEEGRPMSRNKPQGDETAGESERVKGEEEELEVHGGTISISTVYSQRLVKTLREALENSGVNLTKANISVQLKVAKQHSSSDASSFKDEEMLRTRPRTGTEGNDHH